MQRRGFNLPAHYSVVPIAVCVPSVKLTPRQKKSARGFDSTVNPNASSSTSGSKTPRRKNPLAAMSPRKYKATGGESVEPLETEETGVMLPPVFDQPTREVLPASSQAKGGIAAVTSRQSNRVLMKSFGHLLDKATLKFDERFPGQTPSELALLPPPFIDIWKAMDPRHRPDTKSLMSWMAKRRMRLNEAFAERVLTDGKNGVLQPWPQRSDGGRLSSWLYSRDFDNPENEFRMVDWMRHVLQSRGMDAECDAIQRSDGVDIRWVVAMILWLPALQNLNMAKLPFALKYGFLGFLPMLRILDLSDNRLLQSQMLQILGNCTGLERIDVSRCNSLTTLKQLNCCPKLKTIKARDCLGFQPSEDDPEPLLISKSITSFDVHECDSVRCLTIELPAVTYLDLAYYDVLERVRGQLIGIEYLDMSFDPLYYHIRDDLLSQCAPNLLELHLRSCDTLGQIDGLRAAQKLQVLRICCCPKLTSLGFNSSSVNARELSMKPVCPKLRFVDAHNCPMLVEKQLWELVKQRVLSAPPAEAGDSTKKKILKKVGIFKPGDVVTVNDFWIHEDAGKKRMKYMCANAKGITDFLYADGDGEEFTSVSGDDSQLCGVVWPSSGQADKFKTTLSKEDCANFQRARYAGVRRKLMGAIEFGREHPELRKEEAIEELDHGITRMLEVLRPQDFALIRGAMCKGAVPELLPDREIECFLGCGKTMFSEEYVHHESYECPNRRSFVQMTFFIPKIGNPTERKNNDVGIAMNDVQDFMHLAQELQAKVKTWNPAPLKQLLQQIDESDPQYFKEETRTAAWGRQRRLEEKYKLVHPLLKKGNIHVDFDNCTVDILMSISFAARKPPDASAAFDDKGYQSAQEVLKDLSVVVCSYLTPMIVEGHTGQVEPREYWEELAKNRSTLIVENLQKLGVPHGLCKPIGCPGGGAKVLVYPDRSQAKD